LVRYHSNKAYFNGLWVFVVNANPQHRQRQIGRSALTTIEASKKSGLSHNYIWQLLQSGRLEGEKKGRDWLVYEDSLQAFLAQPRLPGRKGPRGPRRKREVRHTEQGERVLLSTAEAQALTGYARDTILRLLGAGRVEGEKSGREWRVYEDSLLSYKQRKHPTMVEFSREDAKNPQPLSETDSFSSLDE
jgi:excisionase family DNA binding protein